MYSRVVSLPIVLILFVCSGASCPRNRQIVNDYAPAVLSPDATLEDVIRVVNANSARIQQVQSVGATLTVPGMLPLETSYAFERPKRFRLRAQTRLAGPEIDIGSSDELYWMWVKRSDEPAVYWGRHEAFDHSAARAVLPVSPDWLIEALGVVQLDPTGQHEGPERSQSGQLQIRSTIPSTQGPLTKVTVVDDTRGWVLEQHLFDGARQPLASALASGFQFDPVTSVSLPRAVDVRLPAAQLNFTLQTERHLINQLSSDPGQLWTLPQMAGFPLVNLDAPASTGRVATPTLMVQRPQRLASRPLPPSSPAIRRLPPFDRLR